MAPSSFFEREIREQPEALSRLLECGRPRVAELAARIRAFAPKFVVIAARGSSDNAARYAQYLFGSHNRLSVALATPSLFTLYGAPPSVAGALVIGISQSGQSPDIVSVLQEGRRQGALTLALTNEPTSALGRAAEFVLPLEAGTERSVAATKTYTNELMVLAMLSTALGGSEERWQEMAAIPAAVSEAIRLNETVEQRASWFLYADYFVTIGRGFNYATAFEVALKIKETTYVIAEPYSSADLLHGPVAMIDKGFPVLVVAPSSASPAADTGALLDMLDKKQAEIIAVSDRAEILDRARAPLPLPTGVPEWLSPMVCVVPGQLWALALARARGLNPDQPRGLTKVTETR
ncbi:MAG: SIS domain-containing protein [Myxococcaceae bacterium]